MQFSAEHHFAGISVPSFERLFFDEAFNEAMCHAVAMERHLESRTEKDQRLDRVVLVYPERKVPGPISKLVGDAKIGYRERLQYDFDRHRGEFSCESTVLSDRVTVEGSIELVAQGQTLIRRVRGDVRVRVFGLGSVIERFIVADVEQGYVDAAAFTEQYLRSHKAP